MTKRPQLSNLSGRLSGKPAASSAPFADDAAAADAPAVKKARAGSQADGRKGVLLRLQKPAWLQLKMLAAELAAERDDLTSMQTVLEDALNDCFKKHGKPPIA